MSVRQGVSRLHRAVRDAVRSMDDTGTVPGTCASTKTGIIDERAALRYADPARALLERAAGHSAPPSGKGLGPACGAVKNVGMPAEENDGSW
ncbi:hypothetical protein ACFYY3_11045 [Streptomyces sp. NPDC001812]|uniref:Uncharacterized protein n=1 Tax=Streptomyces cathayae TaxID=3031124 RepID=A0ABY8JYQ0_9ACTN|nr:hypothetical protein [Streptomyces sp. HUAS 5]WGD40906.1 hypothetical protein PYS65_12500 [Streptomyces sp. HUAS 5]